MRWNRASRREYDGNLIGTETKTWSEFPNGGEAFLEQILASEEGETVRTTVWYPSRKVNHLSKVVWDVLIETTSSMLDEIESKTVHKDKEGDR